MNQQAQSRRMPSAHESNMSDQESTGYISPGQLEMEEDLGLSPDANLPAPPEDRQPYAHPDNTACSSMEHTKGPHASH
jgi:hypothetical protein